MGDNMQVSVPFPQEIIDTQVRLAVAEALGKDPRALIEAVVKVAVGAKVNSYDRETIFQRAVGEMIQGVAKEVFGEWIAENREAVKAAVVKQMRLKSGLAESIAQRVAEGFAKSLYVSVSLTISE